jgi:transcriptional regulator with XRE-family HTH domain
MAGIRIAMHHEAIGCHHTRLLSTRIGRLDRGSTRAQAILRDSGNQVRIARQSSGLSMREAAEAVGMSRASFGRVERGEMANVSVRSLCLAAASVGLEFSGRTYLAGEPIRDAGHLRLLARFRERLPIGAPWATEVPLPIPGDLRTLDARTALGRKVVGIEAEVRLRDFQAIERRVLLKKRDGRLDLVILLVADTRNNRAVLTDRREDLRACFPLDARQILSAISRGQAPAGDGLLLL